MWDFMVILKLGIHSLLLKICDFLSSMCKEKTEKGKFERIKRFVSKVSCLISSGNSQASSVLKTATKWKHDVKPYPAEGQFQVTSHLLFNLNLDIYMEKKSTAYKIKTLLHITL